jgi:transposase
MLNGIVGANGQIRVYIACGDTDMRKSIDGLAAIVQHSFHLDPTGQSLFVFCNRGRDKLKILYWEHNGFWLFYRRLERGRFRWPAMRRDEPLAIDSRQLQWLLDGLDIEQCPRRAHPPVMVGTVV